MRELPHTNSCFVCGETNPHGLRQRFETDGCIVRSRFTPRAEHAGFQGVVHGGLLATVLDEIMVWACAVKARRFAFCAEMTVRYQRPAVPGEELMAVAELVADRRGRIFETKAELRDDAGEVVATATGKYMPVGDTNLAELQRDIVGDLSWVLTPPA
jgi:uncharacterized protein (TIGR00369 family)